MAEKPNDHWAEMRREIEQLLGYPRGAFDPTSNFLRDMERINKVLGEGFVVMQDFMNPQQLLNKIKAGLDSSLPRKR